MKNAGGRLLPTLRGRSNTVLVRPTLTKPHVRGHAISNYPTTRKAIEPPPHLLDVKIPHPGLKSFEQKSRTATDDIEDSGARITVLPNGVRVVSDITKTSSCTVGVTVNAGSRLCTDDNQGAFHLLERMSFKSSNKMDVSDLVKHLEELGGMAIATCTRENILFSIDCLRDQASWALELLADSIFNPKLAEHEIEDQKRIGLIQYEEAPNEPTQLVLELLHRRAYGEKGLGAPIMMTPESATKLSKQTIIDLHDMYFTGNNIVVASVGLPHEELVENARRLFGNVKPHPPAHLRKKISPQFGAYEPDAHKTPEKYAQWVGGMDLVEELPRTQALPPNHRPQTYIGIAFEGVSTHGDDIYTVSVLSMLLGGGGSCSQGGPGKGIFSKLYREVVCRIEEVENLQSLVMMTNDTGIYGAFGSVKPTHVTEHIAAVLESLMSAPNTINDIELQRAKNQLKSSVLQNLENRGIKFEDMTRQVLAYGRKRTTEEMLEKIDSITLAEAKRVAALCVQSKPAIVVYGTPESLEKSPDFDVLLRHVEEAQRALKKKFLQETDEPVKSKPTKGLFSKMFSFGRKK